MVPSPSGVVPRIPTPRLVLRALELRDFEAYAEHMTDEVAMRYMSGVVDRRTAWRLFMAATGGWLLTGAGWWAIERRGEGDDPGPFVGSVGVFFRETSFPLGPGSDLEIGWSVCRPFWRQGYAKEAASAALAYAFGRHAAPRVIAHIDPGNEASVGVSRAIGMRYDGEVDFYGSRSQRYAVSRPG